MSQDLDELEQEFLQDQDAYQKEVDEKMQRRMLVSNFLENK